jgi:hypothetical protein
MLNSLKGNSTSILEVSAQGDLIIAVSDIADLVLGAPAPV